MMAAAEDWLRARGAPKLNLMVREDNAAAAAFYERLGYECRRPPCLRKMARTEDEKVTPPSFLLTRAME